MNRILTVAMLLAIVLGNSTLFAQTRSGKLFNVAKDTLATEVAKDSLFTKNEITLTTDTTSYRFVVHSDSTHNNLQKAYNKDAFKFKNDAFREKMKEPWLGGLLKNIFFN